MLFKIACFMMLMISGASAEENPAPVNTPPAAETALATNEGVRKGISLGITAPQPLMIGYEVSYPGLESLHFFAEGGYFAMSLSSKIKKASVWSVQAGTRFFPFGNWFYALGSFGFRQIGLSTDISNLKLDGISLANNANLTLNAATLNLGVGGQWSLSRKLSLGVDLGIQLPIPLLHGGKTSIVQDQPDGTDLSVDDTDALERITNIPLPQIALVRLIWYID